MGFELDTGDCGFGVGGKNCTVSWWDGYHPNGTFVFNILAAVYGACALGLFLLLLENRSRKKAAARMSNDQVLRGYNFRESIFFSATCSSLGWIFYLMFGAGVRYPISETKGQVSILGASIALSFVVQNAQYLMDMFIESSKSTLSTEMEVDRIEMILKSVLIPWDLHLLTLVLLCIFLFGEKDALGSSVVGIKLINCSASVHILFLSILVPYYLVKMARLLESAIREQRDSGTVQVIENGKEARYKKWRTLANQSRILAVLCGTTGPINVSLSFYAAASTFYDDLTRYFGFVTFAGISVVLFLIAQLELLRPRFGTCLVKGNSQNLEGTKSIPSNQVDSL